MMHREGNPLKGKSRSEYLEKAIGLLLPDVAVIITLFYKGEQSLEEIAQATGYEANTVKVKLHRARQRLKDKLELLLHHEVKDLVRLMNNMEDRLWDYIDGTCLPDERMAIDALLKTDPLVKARYDELSGLNRQLQSMELDEPSMAFKNRVMEQVLVSPHPSTLKTKVDSRIISIIAGFFAASGHRWSTS